MEGICLETKSPLCFANIKSNTSEIIGEMPSSSVSVANKLVAVGASAEYRRSPLSGKVAELAALGQRLDQLLASGHCLTITPFQHGIGQKHGGQYTLTATNAVKAMAAKLQDGADSHLPADQLYAVAWLVTGTSEQELATKLAPVCAILPLPEWCSTLHRLTANSDIMAQPAAAMVPRWKAEEPLIWDPLRRQLMLAAARDALQESENNSPAPATTKAKLAALAAKRAARVPELDDALANKPSLAGMLWSWHGYGEPASLAAQLLESAHPDHSNSMTAGALLLSPFPLTFWQELTP